jgi:DNA-binding transcriptional LysR family regulator
MNFEQLNIITTLAEEKSFSKTANKLYITTSAVSQAVSSLEKELSVIIFKRSKQGSFPTTKGQYIIKNAYKILERQNDIYTYVNNKFTLPKIRLRIGCIPGINSSLIKALYELQKEYPFAEISIVEQNTQDLLLSLQQEKFDFALIAFSNNIKNHNLHYEITKIIDGSFYFVANKNSPIANYEILDYESIISEPLAIYQDKFLLNYLSNIENKAKKPANILFKTNNFISIINAVEENMAISFGPSYSIINEFNHKKDNVKIIPVIEDENIISPSLWFLAIKKNHFDEIGNDLLSLIKEKIKILDLSSDSLL